MVNAKYKIVSQFALISPKPLSSLRGFAKQSYPIGISSDKFGLTYTGQDCFVPRNDEYFIHNL